MKWTDVGGIFVGAVTIVVGLWTVISGELVNGLLWVNIGALWLWTTART